MKTALLSNRFGLGAKLVIFFLISSLLTFSCTQLANAQDQTYAMVKMKKNTSTLPAAPSVKTGLSADGNEYTASNGKVYKKGGELQFNVASHPNAFECTRQWLSEPLFGENVKQITSEMKGQSIKIKRLKSFPSSEKGKPDVVYALVTGGGIETYCIDLEDGLRLKEIK